MDLATLLAMAFVELEDSADAEDATLLQRLRAGTHTAEDVHDVVDRCALIAEEHVMAACAFGVPLN